MIRQQLKYEMQLYFKGTGFVMPFLFTAVFLYFMYSVKPLDVMGGYMTSCLFLFVIMVWIGMSQVQKENTVTEQILFLNIGNSMKYYIGKALILMVISLILSAMIALFPGIQNVLNGGDMFTRPLLLADMINALILLTGCGFCGAALGSLLHARIISDRKLAITGTALLAILTICSYSITKAVPVLKFIMWVLPPVMLPQKVYGNQDFFDLKKSVLIFGLMIVYSFLYFGIKSLLCHKRKF